MIPRAHSRILRAYESSGIHTRRETCNPKEKKQQNKRKVGTRRNARRSMNEEEEEWKRKNWNCGRSVNDEEIKIARSILASIKAEEERMNWRQTEANAHTHTASAFNFAPTTHLPLYFILCPGSPCAEGPFTVHSIRKKRRQFTLEVGRFDFGWSARMRNFTFLWCSRRVLFQQ